MRNILIDRAGKRKRSHTLKAAGLCIDCGKVPPRSNRTTCGPCGNRAAKKSQVYKKRIVGIMRKLGVCIQCLVNESVHGRKLCARCIEERIERQKERRSERRTSGRCPQCGGQPDPGYVTCTACRTMQNRLSAASKARLRKAA